MITQVDVSVVIPTKQRSGLLAAAIASVVNQSWKAQSILVIDDNTDPDEAERTRKVVDQFCSDGAVYVRNERTPGGCGARNTGIMRSKTKYVAFLDDDDLWSTQKLEKQVSYLERFGPCVLFCGYVDHDLNFGQTVTVKPDKEQYKLNDFILGECPTSTTLAIAPKSVLVEAGMFDETLPSLQDFDFWIRCSEIAPIRTIPDILATFVQHKGERVSLNLANRYTALDRVADKLARTYNIDKKRLDGLRSRILYNTLASAAKKHALVDIRKSWECAYLAVRENPFGAKGWKWLAIAPVVRIVFGSGTRD